MAEEPASPVSSPLVSALSSSASSPRSPTIAVTDKELGILEEHVPMVIVQQFIDDNKEKGTPTNTRVADLKKKRDAIKNEKNKSQWSYAMKRGSVLVLSRGPKN